MMTSAAENPAWSDSSISRYQPLGEQVCRALIDEALKIGFDQSQLPTLSWTSLQFTIVKDPADGAECLSGSWLNEAGYKTGTFQLNGDGSFFAEHDIVLPHPSDKRWFVEAVTAWGRDGKIITEPRLLASV